MSNKKLNSVTVQVLMNESVENMNEIDLIKLVRKFDPEINEISMGYILKVVEKYKELRKNKT